MKIKAKVSMGVKVACGKTWQEEVASVIEETIEILQACGRKYGEQDDFIRLPVVVTVSKKGITVASQPDFLPDLVDCEIQVDKSCQEFLTKKERKEGA